MLDIPHVHACLSPWYFVTLPDYDPGIIDVVPVSDPHIAPTPQRVATAQAVLERAQVSPLYDRYEAEKMFLRALKVSELGVYHPAAH